MHLQKITLSMVLKIPAGLILIVAIGVANVIACMALIYFCCLPKPSKEEVGVQTDVGDVPGALAWIFEIR